MTSNSKVSVVIIAKNAERTIGYTLKSLLKQTRKPDEIIVVDDSSNDRTIEIAREYGARVVHNYLGGCGAGRRIGVEEAKYDITVFIDADCIAHPKFIEEILKAYKLFMKENVVAQGGKVEVIKRIDYVDIHGVLRSLKNERTVKEDKYLFVNYVRPAAFSILKKIALEVGNFDENLRIMEGLDLCFRLSERGYKILYNPRAIVYHIGSLRSIKRALRNAKGLSMIMVKYKSIYKSWYFMGLIHVALILSAILLLFLNPLLSAILIGASIAHRIYRAFLKIRKGKMSLIEALIDDFLIPYITYFLIPYYTLKLRNISWRY